MSITIRNPKVEKLALQLARLTGETPDQAIRKSLEERLQELKAAGAGRKNP